VLIAGERRLAACAFLRWREVPVVVDLDNVVKGRRANRTRTVIRGTVMKMTGA
jgi:ParB-like chromosome segregation protein Spo0J